MINDYFFSFVASGMEGKKRTYMAKGTTKTSEDEQETDGVRNY